eukprot:488346_1
MEIIYEYDKNHIITKHFEKKQGKKVLNDANYILQYVDQRKLDRFSNKLIIRMNMYIQYGGDENGWICELNDYIVAIIPNEFQWIINNNTTLTEDTLYVSSLKIIDNSTVSCNQADKFGILRIICKENVEIGEGCSISLSECGVQGAFNND